MYIRNNFVHLYIIGIAAIAKKKKKRQCLVLQRKKKENIQF